MPGTILVSVLELNGLPFPSPPSSVSMKVSLGSREYQAGDKGDFSFPLTTLRDNLVIVIHDSEGNEISHGGVETKSIVERGLWDNIFSLEGGGQVHMKLQFVLNEDEKKRIRKMREAALKRKHGRPIDFRANRVQVATDAGIKLSSSVFPQSTDKVEEQRISSAVPSEKKLDIPQSRADPPMESVRKVEARPLSSPTLSKPVSAVPSAQKLDIQPSRANPPIESTSKVEARPFSSPTPFKPISSVTLAQNLDIQPSRANPPIESVQEVEARPFSSPTHSKPVLSVTLAQKLDNQPSRADPPIESVQEVEPRPFSSPTPSKPISAVTSAQKLDIQPSRANPPMESVQDVEARPFSSPTPSKSVSDVSSSQKLDIQAGRTDPPKEAVRKEPLSSPTPSTSVHSKQSLSLTKSPTSKKRPSLERSPSSVKRMITAFESSRFQDNRPLFKTNIEKQQVSKFGVYSKEKEKESIEPMESSTTGVRGKGVDIKPNEVEKFSDKAREDLVANPPIDTSSTSKNILHRRDEQSDNATPEPANTSFMRRILTHESRKMDNLREQATDIEVEEVEKDDSKPCEELITNSPTETSPASEISIHRHGKTSKVLIMRRTSTQESRKADNCQEKEIHMIPKELDTSSGLHQHDKHCDVVSLEPSKSSIMTRTSIHESRKTDDIPENMVNGFEESSAWIFPDQQRLFCRTTGGENAMNLAGVQGVESDSNREKTIACVPQEIGDDSSNQDNPKPENDEGSEPSTCIFGKVMKVAIMVGFGVLVIFTRQRNSRR